MKPAIQQNISVSSSPVSLNKQSTLVPNKQVYKYGGMTIPSKLVLYKRNYMYAMVPLAQKLQGRKISIYLPKID